MELKNLASCIENCTNPVEGAGYGLLDSSHSKDAGEAIELLIDWHSNKCLEDNDCYLEIAGLWKQKHPQYFRCNYGYLIGSGVEVDFLQEYDEFSYQFNHSFREFQLPNQLRQVAIDNSSIKNCMLV